MLTETNLNSDTGHKNPYQLAANIGETKRGSSDVLFRAVREVNLDF